MKNRGWYEGPDHKKGTMVVGGEVACMVIGYMLPYKETYRLYNIDKTMCESMERARDRMKEELRTRMGIRRFLHIINCGKKSWHITQYLFADEEHERCSRWRGRR